MINTLFIFHHKEGTYIGSGIAVYLPSFATNVVNGCIFFSSYRNKPSKHNNYCSFQHVYSKIQHSWMLLSEINRFIINMSILYTLKKPTMMTKVTVFLIFYFLFKFFSVYMSYQHLSLNILNYLYKQVIYKYRP